MSTVAGCALIASVIGFQVAGGSLYDVYGIRPDFPCIALATIALVLPSFGAISAAVLAGGLLDWAAAGVMGTHMTACLCLVFFILRGRRTGWGDDNFGRILLVTGGILIAILVPHGMAWIQDGRHANPAFLFGATTAYTILFAWPVYKLALPALEWSLPAEQGPGAIRGRPGWQRRG